MNNKIKLSLIIVLSSSALFACSEKDTESDIPLTEVPANIITIVQNTLPGISLTEAEKEVEGETTVYELEGKLISGEKYEIKITETGTIIKVELED